MNAPKVNANDYIDFVIPNEALELLTSPAM